MNGKKYFCVWSDDEGIVCLTSDYGTALDVYGNHMIDAGYVTDDSWADAIAQIEEFDEFPTDRHDIMGVLSDEERIAWQTGSTIVM